MKLNWSSFILIGQTLSFTMTFTKGGATEFARAFFRITEGIKAHTLKWVMIHVIFTGRLVTNEQENSPVTVSQGQSSTDVNDKKNR